MAHHVACVQEARALLGEGPVWDARDQGFYWVDIKSRLVHRHGLADGAAAHWAMPEQIGFVLPRARGGFVAGLRGGVFALELERGARALLVDPEPDKPGNRLNDGFVDPGGALWFGTMDDAEAAPTGALYRLDPSGACARRDAGYSITNGPAMSPDGARLYHVDTLGRVIYGFDVGPGGTLHDKRVFFVMTEDQGNPDGVTVDAEGGVWVAHYGGGRLTRVDANGAISAVLPVPAINVTKAAFGGPDLDMLCITTARMGLDADARARWPLSGGLFLADVGVRGLPQPAFAG